MFSFVKEKKSELYLFIFFVGILTIINAILMMNHVQNIYSSIDFSLFQMMIPTAVSLFFLKRRKNKIYFTYFPKVFLSFFLVFFVINIYQYLIPKNEINRNLIEILRVLFSVSLWIGIFNEEEEVREKFKLNFFSKKSFIYLVLYMILIFLTHLLSCVIKGEIQNFYGDFLRYILDMRFLLYIFTAIPSAFFLYMGFFFGEEFAWRVYLQDILLRSMEPRKGIFLLCFIWGVWHLPFDILLLKKEIIVFRLIWRLVVCLGLGIFYSYTIIKTKSVFMPVCLHAIQNNLSGQYLYSIGVIDLTLRPAFRSSDIIEILLIYSVLFLPFLFSKEFGVKKSSKHS